MLTQTQMAFFANMEELFARPGWARLKSGWMTERDQIFQAAFFGASDMRDLDRARERFGLLEELIRLPEAIAEQRALLESGEPEAP